MRQIDAARRCIDFHVTYTDFLHELVMQGVAEIMNSVQAVPGVQVRVDPSLPPGTLELRYGRKVVGTIVNLAVANLPDDGGDRD